MNNKKTFVYCATSSSTVDFKVDCIEDYLKKQLRLNKDINELILFLDNGLENSVEENYRCIEHYWGIGAINSTKFDSESLPP